MDPRACSDGDIGFFQNGMVYGMIYPCRKGVDELDTGGQIWRHPISGILG